MKRSRKAWIQASRRIDFRKLIFLDETGTKTNMTRLCGWGPRLERVTEPVPHGHWITTTLVQPIDYRGCRAAMTTNGPMNAYIFDRFVDWILLPSLKSGDILVMDNLSSHKNISTLLKFESKSVEVRFLPPYSPDLNPIEKIYSKIKAILRGLAARTSPTLEKTISTAIKSITPLDCLNRFHACGYGLYIT
jgi:transposase